MADSSMLKHLIAATGLYQSAVDGALIQASSSVDGYRLFLARTYGWERGLEAALAHVAGFEWELRSRAKSPTLADDLLALGMTADEVFALPSCVDAVDEVADTPAALGWLFVSERVSFAHGMAYHQLHGSVRRFATSYFDSLLTRTAWLDVVTAIDRMSSDQDALGKVIAGATSAFRSKRAWLGPPPKRTRTIAALPKNDQVLVENGKAKES